MGLTTDHQLGALEAAIIDVIYQHDEMTVREMWQALQRTRPLAYTTVMTVMSRMVPKGLLAVRKQGKAYYYRAAAAPDELKSQRAQAALRDVLQNFGDVALVQMIREIDDVDPERLARLRALAGEDSTNAS